MSVLESMLRTCLWCVLLRGCALGDVAATGAKCILTAAGPQLGRELLRPIVWSPMRHSDFPQQARDVVKTLLMLQARGERNGAIGLVPKICITECILPMSLDVVVRPGLLLHCER